MIFATDLDRTMIYSKKFIQPFQEEAIGVEVYKEDVISYVTPKTIELLKKVNEKMLLIPITTRNKAQYKRIKLFQKEVMPPIYIVNNGGTIFIEGKEDAKWSNHIKQCQERLVVDYEEIMALFLKIYQGEFLYYKLSDELLWLIISDEDKVHHQSIEAFAKYCKDLGWRIANQGRKTYIYPHFLTKWYALKYIKDQYIDRKIVCAGDSMFDYEMVHKGHYGIVPKGAFIEERCDKKIRFTKKEGLSAAEEILTKALQLYDDLKKSC